MFDSLAQMRFPFPEPSEGVSEQRPSMQMLISDVELSRLLLKKLVLKLLKLLLLKVGAVIQISLSSVLKHVLHQH